MINRVDALEALKNVNDPELMINIVDLGLVYRVEVSEDKVEIDYTLTSPGCPLSEMIESEIHHKMGEICSLPLVLNLVWAPMWGPEFMTDEAKVELGYPI